MRCLSALAAPWLIVLFLTIPTWAESGWDVESVVEGPTAHEPGLENEKAWPNAWTDRASYPKQKWQPARWCSTSFSADCCTSG